MNESSWNSIGKNGWMNVVAIRQSNWRIVIEPEDKNGHTVD